MSGSAQRPQTPEPAKAGFVATDPHFNGGLSQALHPQPPTVLPELDRGPTSHRLVALTFDAGSSAAPTPGILHALKAAGLRCTFFLTGEWTDHNRSLVRRIAEAGHEFGNHTYTHPDLCHVSSARVGKELDRTEALVQEVAGRGTRPYFRPPFGARDSRVLREAARHGYRCVYWTTDSLDSVKEGITSRQIERRVLSHLQPGSIILMHCGSEATAEALPHLLALLHKRDYQVVTISELLRSGKAGSLTRNHQGPTRSFKQG